MTIDIEGIARGVHCDPTSLKTALPLIRQGYSPAFLARYRRDELGGVSEEALLALATQVRRQSSLEERRGQIVARCAAADPPQPVAQLVAENAERPWELDRAMRIFKVHSGLPAEALRLATAAVNPDAGDPSQLDALAEKVLADADNVQVEAAHAALEEALAEVLRRDLRVLRPTAAWFARSARIEIGPVVDPNVDEDEADEKQKPKSRQQEALPKPATPPESASSAAPTADDSAAEAPAPGAEHEPAQGADAAAHANPASSSQAAADTSASDASSPPRPTVEPAPDAPPADVTAVGSTVTPPAETAAGPAAAAASDPAAEQPQSGIGPEGAEGVADPPGDAASAVHPGSDTATATANAAPAGKTASGAEAPGSGKQRESANKAKKSAKRLSPRQRRRRWLVSVLRPIQKKTITPTKLSTFQRLVLLRGRRSELVHPRLVYDKAAALKFLQKQANRLNPSIAPTVRAAFDAYGDEILAAAEDYFWEAMVENARLDLVDALASQLDQSVGRQPVQASVVLAIDAIGPRTASVAILNSQKQLVHTEDVPCQMSTLLRQQLVSRLGELVHQHHVQLIAVSNGPARRACILALDELLQQSPPGSIRWTLVERSGADVFASGPAGDHQMRQVPRRFRAAAWLARLLMSPAEAIAAIDPTKMRLTSYQRELDPEAISEALEDRVRLGLSLRGADANADPPALLARMPGMDRELAERLDEARRKELFSSRDALQQVAGWTDQQRRQAIGFLRVFGSTQTLDGTSIHPDDYPLAMRLSQKLGIPLPPAKPPGYVDPDYSQPEPEADTQPEPERLAVEDVDVAKEEASTFAAGVEAESEASTEAELNSSSAETSDAAAPAQSADAEASSVGDAPPAEAAEGAAEPGEQGEATTAENAGDTEVAEGSAASGAAENTAEQPEAAPQPEPTPSVTHPRPDEKDIARVIKEWQVGPNRVHQIVDWLCAPFSYSTRSSDAVPVMDNVPTLSSVKPGDFVVGTVVGVTGFGAFVELGPECNGLIHVSKLSDGFVEDPHQYVQVGDVVSAWVVDIDRKRKRVGLSCVSPERAAAVRQRRAEDPARGARPAAAAATRGRGREQASGPRPRGERPAGGRPGGGGGRDRGGSRGRRGRSGESQPRTIVQVSGKPQPKQEISAAMQRGEEPMRSFSDLLQLYEKQNPLPAPQEPPATASGSAPETPAAESKEPTAEPDKSAAGSPPTSNEHAADPPQAAASNSNEDSGGPKTEGSSS